MNVYQQILLKLHEATGGNEKRVVSLVDLVRREGYGGAVDDILTFMNREGWVAESGGTETVTITSWGNAEVRKLRASTGGASDLTDGMKRVLAHARSVAEAVDQLAKAADAGDEAETLQGRHEALKRLSALKESIERLGG